MELFNEIQSGCEAGIYQPLLAYLSAKKMGRALPKFTPEFKPVSLYKLAKLAQLYEEAGFKKEAGTLCDLLDKVHKFPTLWCSEKEYNPKQFYKIYEKLSSIARISSQDLFDVSLIEEEGFTGALTRSGNGTSLGTVRFKETEIRAFGPQNMAHIFGVQGISLEGWTQTKASKEIWLKLDHYFEKDQLQLKFHLVGLKPENPQHIAFYVKAKEANVENRTFLPKSLERFKGQSSGIIFDSYLHLQPSIPLNTEIIPLAGEGCYWDSDFLILFEVTPFLSQVAFSLFRS